MKTWKAQRLRDNPTLWENYAEHFGKARLEACRHHEPVIDALLGLLGV